MPVYDTICEQCAFESTETVRIADVTAWDLAAVCPECQAKEQSYHRYIKTAPSKKELAGYKGKMSVTDYETMRHNHSKTVNRDQIAEARENVKSGKYEGF